MRILGIFADCLLSFTNLKLYWKWSCIHFKLMLWPAHSALLFLFVPFLILYTKSWNSKSILQIGQCLNVVSANVIAPSCHKCKIMSEACKSRLSQPIYSPSINVWLQHKAFDWLTYTCCTNQMFSPYGCWDVNILGSLMKSKSGQFSIKHSKWQHFDGGESYSRQDVMPSDWDCITYYAKPTLEHRL